MSTNLSEHLSEEEVVIYNDGERLLPGITHSMEELIRHQSSYEFFISVIEADLKRQNIYGKKEVTIVDFGFGTGHGCKALSRIPKSKIVGIDVSEDCLAYAKKYYSAPNITFTIADIIEFVSKMPPFDYVVSRGVIEHVRDGINVMVNAKWRNRLMIDVPYDEPYDINQHHLVSRVTEKDFANYPSKEIFYEEVSGEIYKGVVKEPIPNMIMCVSSRVDFPKVGEMLTFPVPAWKPNCSYEEVRPTEVVSQSSFWKKIAGIFTTESRV